MIKVITVDGGEKANRLWVEMKKEIEKSLIMEIEIEREVASITNDLGITEEKIHTGIVDIKIRYLRK